MKLVYRVAGTLQLVYRVAGTLQNDGYEGSYDSSD
jgi:hypothetical protein